MERIGKFPYFFLDYYYCLKASSRTSALLILRQWLQLWRFCTTQGVFNNIWIHFWLPQPEKERLGILLNILYYPEQPSTINQSVPNASSVELMCFKERSNLKIQSMVKGRSLSSALLWMTCHFKSFSPPCPSFLLYEVNVFIRSFT